VLDDVSDTSFVNDDKTIWAPAHAHTYEHLPAALLPFIARNTDQRPQLRRADYKTIHLRTQIRSSIMIR